MESVVVIILHVRLLQVLSTVLVMVCFCWFFFLNVNAHLSMALKLCFTFEQVGFQCMFFSINKKYL